ncbi:hypothetical protein MML48_2g00002950 [Holotrichia oblita]|uniref:Uncharacterized protein n=1 Tax=Holotrichia oblita TaxID=644536 RepID=A0ACB9TQ82_HOLOL|nr:hypothetical protein MML48_2g00002950 [Holotrichia oblita]
MSDLENKLDEDFLFYLSFTNSFLHRLPEPGDIAKCQAWMAKLCGTPCVGVEQKRYRNIFLSNLVLCMQEGKLAGPFIENPQGIHLADAAEYFGEIKINIEAPDWLEDIVTGGAKDDGDEGAEDDNRTDGRTYVATRAMPEGQGAFAYVAISLAEQEPKWLGGGEGVFESHLKEKFQEYVPEPTEMEKILARRKDPKERERVITFYDILIQNINDELDGALQSENNETVNGLVDQMVNDLKSKGQYGPYQLMPDKKRRTELLLMLHDRVFSRREKVKKREEVLDNIEASMPKSFFDASISGQDKYELPSIMWEQAINKAPAKRHLTHLQERYPELLNRK